MKEYKVTWQIQLTKMVKAKSEEKAKEVVENIDCQYDGSYKVDSFELIDVEKQ